MKKFFVAIGFIYAFLFMFGEQKANFFISALFVLFIPFIFAAFLLRNNLYKLSIFIVPKCFVCGKNSVSNKKCLVRYYPDNKISVMDNISNEIKEIRSFVLSSSDTPNINKCWFEVCQIFDAYTSVDMLMAFWNRYGYRITLNVLENKNYIPPEDKKITDKNTENNTENNTPIPPVLKKENLSAKSDFMPTYEIEKNKISKQAPIAGIKDTEHVDLSQLMKHNNEGKVISSNGENIEISDLANNNQGKLDINFANSEALAALPGINIIGAKKAVTYRNKNGKFNDIEEFFAIVGVKDYFKDKLREKIIVTKSVDAKHDDFTNNEKGRIVDL